MERSSYSSGDVSSKIMSDVSRSVSSDITNDFMRNPSDVLSLLNNMASGNSPFGLSEFPSASTLLGGGSGSATTEVSASSSPASVSTPENLSSGGGLFGSSSGGWFDQILNDLNPFQALTGSQNSFLPELPSISGGQSSQPSDQSSSNSGGLEGIFSDIGSIAGGLLSFL